MVLLSGRRWARLCHALLVAVVLLAGQQHAVRGDGDAMDSSQVCVWVCGCVGMCGLVWVLGRARCGMGQWEKKRRHWQGVPTEPCTILADRDRCCTTAVAEQTNRECRSLSGCSARTPAFLAQSAGLVELHRDAVEARNDLSFIYLPQTRYARVFRLLHTYTHPVVPCGGLSGSLLFYPQWNGVDSPPRLESSKDTSQEMRFLWMYIDRRANHLDLCVIFRPTQVLRISPSRSGCVKKGAGRMPTLHKRT